MLWNRVQTVHGVAASEWHNKAAFKYKQNLHTVNNDTEFFMTFTNDVNNSCAAPVQTTYKFTKQ